MDLNLAPVRRTLHRVSRTSRGPVTRGRDRVYRPGKTESTVPLLETPVLSHPVSFSTLNSLLTLEFLHVLEIFIKRHRRSHLQPQGSVSRSARVTCGKVSPEANSPIGFLTSSTPSPPQSCLPQPTKVLDKSGPTPFWTTFTRRRHASSRGISTRVSEDGTPPRRETDFPRHGGAVSVTKTSRGSGRREHLVERNSSVRQ